MATFDELVAAIRSALSTVAEGKTATAQGRSALIEGTAALTGIARGSTSYQLRSALEALSAAIRAAERAEEVEATVLEAMGVYLSEVGGRGVTGPATSPPTEPQPQRPSGAPRGADGKIDFRALIGKLRAQGVVGLEGRSLEQVPDFAPTQFNPACWQGLAPRQQNGPARGNLFFADGRRWNTEPLESTGGVSAFDLDTIRSAFRDFKPAQGHLEGNTASWMADNHEREMVLYINERPCLHAGSGCRRTLQHFLPEGYKLHVHARYFDKHESRWLRRHYVYEGTGKAFTHGPQPRYLPSDG